MMSYEQNSIMKDDSEVKKEFFKRYLFSIETYAPYILSKEKVFSFYVLLLSIPKSEKATPKDIISTAKKIIYFLSEEPLFKHALFISGREKLFKEDLNVREQKFSEIHPEDMCEKLNYTPILKSLNTEEIKYISDVISVSFRELLISYKRYFCPMDVTEFFAQNFVESNIEYHKDFSCSISKNDFLDHDLEDIKHAIQKRCIESFDKVLQIYNEGKIDKLLEKNFYKGSIVESSSKNDIIKDLKLHLSDKISKKKLLDIKEKQLISLNFMQEILKKDSSTIYILFIDKLIFSFLISYQYNTKEVKLSDYFLSSVEKLSYSKKNLKKDIKTIKRISRQFSQFIDSIEKEKEKENSLLNNMFNEVQNLYTKLTYEPLKSHIIEYFSYISPEELEKILPLEKKKEFLSTQLEEYICVNTTPPATPLILDSTSYKNKSPFVMVFYYDSVSSNLCLLKLMRKRLKKLISNFERRVCYVYDVALFRSSLLKLKHDICCINEKEIKKIISNQKLTEIHKIELESEEVTKIFTKELKKRVLYKFLTIIAIIVLLCYLFYCLFRRKRKNKKERK